MKPSTPGIEDFHEAELGDARRKKRLDQVARAVAQQPKATLPQVVSSEAELEALYRFLNNPNIEFETLLQPHRLATAERAVTAGSVLAIHDTTSFQFSHADPKEVGFLPTGKPGFLGHFVLAVTAEGTRRPLGVLSVQSIFRKQRSRRGGRKKRLGGGVTTTWADRESSRWLKGVAQAQDQLSKCAEVIHVMDREADSFSLFAEMLARGASFVVRVRHDRKAREAEEEQAPWSKLKSLAAEADCCLQREVPLSRRRAKRAPTESRRKPPRKGRLAQLHFAATCVELNRPRYFSAPIPEQLRVNVVRVYEVAAPQGQEPVEWLLVTSEPADTPEQIARVVDIYRARWVIEEFFKALKTGCIYEQRQLESRHALLNTLALFLPVACQLLWIRSRAHHAAESPANDVLTPRQIEILRALSSKPLPTELTASDVLRAIAALGGHWRSNGPPGWLILRRGLEKVLYAELGWLAHEKTLGNANHR